jgi:hypothetical protein
MKPAILYTLNATEIVAGDYHHLIRSNMRPVFTFNPDEAIAPMRVDHFAVPIHRVTRVRRPQTMPLHIDPWMHGDYEDVFFALEPALQEILEAPFKHLADNAVDERRKAEIALETYKSLASGFKSLPWWKRAWRAATGNMEF